MQQHTNEEHEYVRNLKQLIDYTSMSEKGRQHLDPNFQDISLPNSVQDVSYQQRNKNCKGKRSKSSLITSNKKV